MSEIRGIEFIHSLMCATAAVNLKVPGYKGRWKAYLLLVLNGTVKKILAPGNSDD
jgi:hypothetical protein